MRDYQFPPQLGEKTIYFGYYIWEWGIIVLGGAISTFIAVSILNAAVLLPIVFFSLTTVKPKDSTSMMQILYRAYKYFISQPISYIYIEEE